MSGLRSQTRSDRLWKLAAVCRDQGDTDAAIAALVQILQLADLPAQQVERSKQELQRLRDAH